MVAVTLPVFAIWVVAWAGLTYWLRRRRYWLAFYGVGALGFTLLVTFGSKAFGLATAFQALQARQVATLASAVGMNVQPLGGADLAIGGGMGWSVFFVGLECSGLLESAVFCGLVGFYPAFSAKRRVVTVAGGLAATYVINVARIILIVAILSAMGTSWVFAAHAVLGRLFFFTATVAVYWYLVTQPTIEHVSERFGEAGD